VKTLRGMVLSLTMAFTAAVALIVMTPASALARGDGWEFLPAFPVDAACGSTVVHVTFPMNKEYGRFTTLDDGTIVLDVTGALKTTFTTDAGATVPTNSSGPGTLLFRPNGDLEVHQLGPSSGSFTEEQAAALGVPQIYWSKGPMKYIFHADGSVSPINISKNITDICAELGV
jgi:hypothetical protein